jgi:hypothetical protein
MAIRLIVKLKYSDRTHVVPVASFSSFQNNWKPAISRLGLRLVPEFEDPGLSLHDKPQLLEQVIEELDQLLGYLSTDASNDLPHVETEDAIRNISRLINELRVIQQEQDRILSIYIG